MARYERFRKAGLPGRGRRLRRKVRDDTDFRLGTARDQKRVKLEGYTAARFAYHSAGTAGARGVFLVVPHSQA